MLQNGKLEKKLKKASAALKKLEKNQELEDSLERLRAQAMSLRKQDDSSGICEVLFTELRKFGFADLRKYPDHYQQRRPGVILKL